MFQAKNQGRNYSTVTGICNTASLLLTLHTHYPSDTWFSCCCPTTFYHPKARKGSPNFCVDLIKVEPKSLSLQPSSRPPPWLLWRFKSSRSSLAYTEKDLCSPEVPWNAKKSLNAHAAKQAQLCVWICRSEEIHLGPLAYSLQFDSLQQANCQTGPIFLMCLSIYWLSKIIFFVICFCSCCSSRTARRVENALARVRGHLEINFYICKPSFVFPIFCPFCKTEKNIQHYFHCQWGDFLKTEQFVRL